MRIAQFALTPTLLVTGDHLAVNAHGFDCHVEGYAARLPPDPPRRSRRYLPRHKVEDPYRWLEDDVRNSPEVAEWVKAENRLTESYLAAIPQRETIRRRLTELWNFAQYSPYMKEGGRYFFFKNDGLQNQPVLYVTESLEAEPRVLIDPNTWSKDGTIALGEMGFSDDGKYLAYSRSEAGAMAQRRRQVPGLQPLRGRQRLVDLARPGNRHRPATARRAEVDQVLQRLLDQGRQGLFL